MTEIDTPIPEEQSGAAGHRSPWAVAIVVAAVVAVIALEVGAYRWHGWFERVAAWLWAAMGVGFVALGVSEIARAGWEDLRRRNALTAILLVLIAAAMVPGIDGVEILPIYHEAPREIAHGLDAMKQPGWFYTGIGHIGYPNRQFLIAAAPSAIFGRGLVPLRLGFGLPFLFGILLFWAGTRRLLADRASGPAVASLTTIAVLAFPYAVEHLHNYEQTVFPLAATLAATGWLVLTAARPTVPKLLGLAWIGALLGTSYTPNVAAWLLMIAALGWLAATAWRKGRRSTATGWISVALLIAVVGGLSFTTRLDFFKPETGNVKPDVTAPIIDGLGIFFFGEPEVFIPALLFLPLMVCLVVSAAGRNGFPAFVIGWWILGTVIAGCALHGYSLRPMEIEMFRVLVVIPPLLLLTAWSGMVWMRKHDTRFPTVFALIFSALLVIQVVWNLAAGAYRHNPALQDLVYADMVAQGRSMGITPDRPPTIILITERSELDGTGDHLPYFFPGHLLIRDPAQIAPESLPDGPLLYYTDIDRRFSHPPPWPDPGEPRIISFDHPYHHHTMVGWSRSGG